MPFLDGHAHAGIAAATWQLVAEFVPRVAAALARHSGYQAVLTGHSMGAGVAALLAMLLHRCARNPSAHAASRQNNHNVLLNPIAFALCYLSVVVSFLGYYIRSSQESQMMCAPAAGCVFEPLPV